MTDDNTDIVEQVETTAVETPFSEPAKGLDSIITQALADHPLDAPQGDEDTRSTDSRTRDERGRFAPKDADANAAPDRTAAPGVDPAKTQPVEQPQALDPPAHFKAEWKAEFAKLPVDAQKLVHTVEQARSAEFTRRSQEVAQYRQFADPLVQAVHPHLPYFKEIGLHPATVLQTMIQTEMVLRTGTPQQKIEVFAKVAQDYGLDLGALSRGEWQFNQPDPAQTQLRQLIQEQGQKIAQFERMFTEQQDQAVSAELSAFANAKDSAGHAKHPHYERVKHVMGQLMVEGKAETLEDAYSKAVAPIQAAVAEELKRSQAQAQQREKDAVEQAKRARGVRSTGSPGAGKTAPSGLDGHLKAALAKHGMH